MELKTVNCFPMKIATASKALYYHNFAILEIETLWEKKTIWSNSCYWSWARCQIFLCLERHTNEAKGSIQCKVDPFASFACQTADNCDKSYCSPYHQCQPSWGDSICTVLPSGIYSFMQCDHFTENIGVLYLCQSYIPTLQSQGVKLTIFFGKPLGS